MFTSKVLESSAPPKQPRQQREGKVLEKQHGRIDKVCECPGDVPLQPNRTPRAHFWLLGGAPALVGYSLRLACPHTWTWRTNQTVNAMSKEMRVVQTPWRITVPFLGHLLTISVRVSAGAGLPEPGTVREEREEQ